MFADLPPLTIVYQSTILGLFLSCSMMGLQNLYPIMPLLLNANRLADLSARFI